jgi:hypothetical protein
MSTEKEQMRGRGIRTLGFIPFLLSAHVPGDVAGKCKKGRIYVKLLRVSHILA